MSQTYTVKLLFPKYANNGNPLNWTGHVFAEDGSMDAASDAAKIKALKEYEIQVKLEHIDVVSVKPFKGKNKFHLVGGNGQFLAFRADGSRYLVDDASEAARFACEDAALFHLQDESKEAREFFAACRWTFNAVSEPFKFSQTKALDGGPSNGKRAGWAEHGVGEYALAVDHEREVSEEKICDLITDLCHLMDKLEIDAAGSVESALHRWREER